MPCCVNWKVRGGLDTLYLVYVTLLLGVKVRNLRSGEEAGWCQTVHTCHSSTPDLSDTHPQPPALNLLAWHSCLKPRGCRCREGQRMALLKCYSKCFCHKLVNLFHVFVRHWNPALLCLACHHDISCSLQTIRRCWTYFKSVCLDWQDTVGETGLKLSKAVPGQALSSKITLSVSHWVCFRRILLTVTQLLA